jgi:hypothetical protein
MPTIQPSDPEIRVIQGIHVYHFFMTNCAQRVNLALAFKSFIKRGGFAPARPRLLGVKT